MSPFQRNLTEKWGNEARSVEASLTDVYPAFRDMQGIVQATFWPSALASRGRVVIAG